MSGWFPDWRLVTSSLLLCSHGVTSSILVLLPVRATYQHFCFAPPCLFAFLPHVVAIHAVDVHVSHAPAPPSQFSSGGSSIGLPGTRFRRLKSPALKTNSALHLFVPRSLALPFPASVIPLGHLLCLPHLCTLVANTNIRCLPAGDDHFSRSLSVEAESGLLYKMTTMLPPATFTEGGVSVCHLLQQPVCRDS